LNALEQKPKETEQSDWTVPSNPDLEKIAAAAAAPNAAKATGERPPAADAQQVANAATNGQAEGVAQEEQEQVGQQGQQAIAVTPPVQLAVVVRVPDDVAGQTIDNMYVVRGMTKQKAEELSQALVSAGEQQSQVEQKPNIAQVQEAQRMQYGVNATVRLVEALAEAANETDETADRLPPAVSSIVSRYFDLGVEMPKLDGIVHHEISQQREDPDNGVAAMSAPATQPSDGQGQAAASTADEQVDVVIMVQSNTLATPAAPATQPVPANASEINAK
jgi:hypothetical protein